MASNEEKMLKVKELLFGEEVQRFENDFSQVENKINAYKEEHEKWLKNIEVNLEQSEKAVTDNFTMELQKLQASLDEKSNELQQNIATLRHESVSKTQLAHLFGNLSNLLQQSFDKQPEHEKLS